MIAKLFGPFFIFAGIMHFVIPKTYEAIMPGYLPAHRELVYASGVAEALGGALTIHPATRRAGVWLSVLTLIGVFPANLNMALNPGAFKHIPKAALWARLPFQAVFIAWAIAAGRRDDG